MAQLFDWHEPSAFAEDPKPTKGTSPDLETTKLLQDVLTRVRDGMPIDFDAIHVDPDARFFVLGLSPNSSRLSVRFWHADSFGNMLHRVAQHHADLAIAVPSNRRAEYISPRAILRETAPLRDPDRIPPLLGGGLMRAILTGQPYPQGLYTAMIARIRADRDVNYVRAATIKAVLSRNRSFRKSGATVNNSHENHEVTLTVSLDENSTNPAYRLGRLFAVLEKVQQDANPGLNSTIRDRYFGAASATPRAVFPQLLRLTQHHVAKAEYGRVSDKQIESILADLSNFPTHLGLGDQGLFMLGYYHQRQAFYQKSTTKE